MPNEQTQTGASTSKARTTIAKWVIGGSAGGLIALGFAMILTAETGNTGPAAEKVFTMLVPLLGTWVGTVLAYYFSGENFERASQSVTRLVEQVSEKKLRRVSVREAMTPRHAITVLELEPGDDEGAEINLEKKLLDLLKDPITRIPVFDSEGKAKYIIHQSLLFRFIAEKTIEMTDQTPPFEVPKQTLKDFLDHKNMKEIVSGTFTFVSIEGTLADAKDAMDKLPKCQDVFVTDDGTKGKPVVGWVTNTNISKYTQL